jgi:MFS family permease
VLGVRVADRIGKAVRTPARDALIADLSPASARGHAFGFNKAMDKAGSLIGLLLAAAVIAATQSGAGTLTRGAFQAVTLLAVIPGIAAVIVLVRAVREPPHPARDGATSRAAGETPAALATPDAHSAPQRARLGPAFWAYLVILALFSLGNSSDAFLTLRAQSVGFPAFGVFLVIAGFSAVVALTSTAAGAWSDRFGRRRLIVAGWAVYAAIYFGFAMASQPWHVAALYAGYGLYYGAFQGAATALVADIVPPERRGAAYGFFHAAVGVAALPASWVAGWLWQRYGAPAPFWFGGGLALLASIALTFVPLPRRGGP